jgi:hypothetical protein
MRITGAAASLAIASAWLLAGCGAAATAANSGPAATRTFSAGAFNAVSLQSADDVLVIPGTVPGVVASGPAAELDRLDIHVDGNSLIITRKPGKYNGYTQGVTVTVTSPGIAAAVIAGSGDMTITRVAGPSFKGAIAGSGDMIVKDLRVNMTSIDLTGSGNFRAAGTAGVTSLSIAGSGDLEGAALTSSSASISSTGSGDAAIVSRGKTAISITGSGDVTVTGTSDCVISKTGTGDGRCAP